MTWSRALTRPEFQIKHTTSRGHRVKGMDWSQPLIGLDDLQQQGFAGGGSNVGDGFNEKANMALLGMGSKSGKLNTFSGVNSVDLRFTQVINPALLFGDSTVTKYDAKSGVELGPKKLLPELAKNLVN